MTLPRVDFILRNALRVVIFCLILLKGNANVQSPVESTTGKVPTTPTSTQTSRSTETHRGTSPPTTTEASDITAAELGSFSNSCLDTITHYAYNAIVYYNMNVSQAAALHSKSDEFKELAKNISTTLMVFANQIAQVVYMYNPCTEPLLTSSKLKFAAFTKPSSRRSNQSCPQAGMETANESDITVPILVLIILVLCAYIGYMSYAAKTKYYRTSNMLINDHN